MFSLESSNSVFMFVALFIFVQLGNQCAEYWIIIVIVGLKFRGAAGRAEVRVISIQIVHILLGCINNCLGWM